MRDGGLVHFLYTHVNLADALCGAGRLRGGARDRRGGRRARRREGRAAPLADDAARRAGLRGRRVGRGRGRAALARAPGDGHDLHQRLAAPDRARARPRRPRRRAPRCSTRPTTSPPTRANRSGSGRWARCARSSSGARAISTPRARRSTTRWTGSTSARRTSGGWRAWPRPGTRVEADAAVRARDLGEDPAFAIGSAEALIARVEACAEGERPVEAAFLASARAELARARGSDDPALWTAAVAAWEALGRPYRAAQALRARPRHCSARGDRDAASESAAAALGRRAGDRRRLAGVRDRGLRAARAAAAGARRAFAGARADLPRTPAKTRSGSRRVSARCSRSWPTGARTARSARRSTWPRRPRASMSRGSSPSWTCAHGPRPRRSLTGSAWSRCRGAGRRPAPWRSRACPRRSRTAR